jgi:uncharacterized membrane protein YphA (DoxX/SURF4 family)
MVDAKDLSLLGLRIVLGGIWVVHAVPKVTAPAATPFPNATFAFGIGVVELLDGLFLLFGMFTRLTSVPLMGIIVAAMAIVQLQETGTLLFGLHAALERDILILAGLFTVFANGPGRYALEFEYASLELFPKLRGTVT